MGKIESSILKINADAQFSVEDNDVTKITWLDGTTPISQSDIEAQYPAVELELALEEVRRERNFLISQTDFYALSDVTMSSDMQTYRQNLRDITNGLDTVEKCNNVTWPTKP